MSSEYVQPNGAMHSYPTSHMEKKGLTQIVTLETRMMQSNNYTKKSHMLSTSWNETPINLLRVNWFISSMWLQSNRKNLGKARRDVKRVNH